MKKIILLFVFSNLIYSQSNIFNIKTDDFTATFSSIPFEETKIQIKNVADSVLIYLEPGYSIERSVIDFKYEKVTDLKAFQKYQTSISITSEGPHLDLLSWKHFESEWKELRKIDKGKFKAIEYEKPDREKFPQVHINQLKQAVLDFGGEKWYNRAKHVKSIYQPSSNVGISKIYLKITYKKNIHLKTKYLIFIMPLGC